MPTLFPETTFDAFLFDMDGTVLSSIVPVERIWSGFARTHGLDPQELTARIHGVRARDFIASLGLPDIDVEAEVERMNEAEMTDMDGICAIPGAEAFLQALPPDRWAIVTSAFRPLAERRLEAAGLPVPGVLVAADDVTRGKPAPDGFLLAAERLGASAQRCLVFEDAIPGIAAAEAAGAAVAVVTATHRHGWRADLPCLDSYEHLATAQHADGRISLRATRNDAPQQTA